MVLFNIFFLKTIYSKTITLDKIIARINSEVIFDSDIKQNIFQYSSYNNDIQKIRFQIFKNLMIAKLFLSKSQIKEDIDPTHINIYFKDRMNQLISTYGSEKKLEEAAKMPISSIRKLIKKRIKESYMIDVFKARLTKDITVNINEVKEALKNEIIKPKIHNEQIILKRLVIHFKVNKNEKRLLKKKLFNLRKQILKGEKFENLARKFSDHKNTAINGGDIGFYWKEEDNIFHKNYQNAAMKLKPIKNSNTRNFISDVIETPNGIYLIQLIDVKGDEYRTRHIFLNFKTLENEKKNIFNTLNKLKKKIENQTTSLDTELSKFNKDTIDYKQSGFVSNENADIKFEKKVNKLPFNMDDNTFNLPEKTCLGPSLVTTKNGQGYQIIQIFKKYGKRKANLELDFEELSKILLSKKRERKINKWIKEAKESSIIEIDPAYSKYANKLWNTQI